MECYTLEHIYDYIEKELGYEAVERMKTIINEHVSRETQALKDRIDTYQGGFEDALWYLDEYHKKYGDIEKGDDYNNDEYIIKTKELSNRIYKPKKIDYYA